MTSHTSAALAVMVAISTLLVNAAWAHCDSMDGPVIRDARAALEARDATPVLKWVAAELESEIREAFRRTVEVRAFGEDARRLADQYFFETLVRIHRAGEGEAFTGLKPAGSADPGLVAADEALESGAGAELVARLSGEIAAGLRERFEIAHERKKHAADSVDAGREYVEAYVDYVHFVENVHRLATHGAPRAHHDASDLEVGPHSSKASPTVSVCRALSIAPSMVEASSLRMRPLATSPSESE